MKFSRFTFSARFCGFLTADLREAAEGHLACRTQVLSSDPQGQKFLVPLPLSGFPVHFFIYCKFVHIPHLFDFVF